MNKTPRSPAFKKKVALEAIKEEHSIKEIAQTYGIHPVQVCQWKKALLDGAESIFAVKRKKAQDPDAERANLERKIGQLSVENDWLKKKLGV